MCSKRSCPCCWCPDSRLDVTDKMASTDKLQMYWHKWTLRGTSCWTTKSMCCGGREIMTKPPAVFDLPPETHRQTIVQGPLHAPMVRTRSKTCWYSTSPLNSWTRPVLDLWTSGMFRSITSPPQHLPSTWAKSESPMCWVACR